MAVDGFRQRRAEAVHGAGRVPALRMDFDFKGGGGFVVARRALQRAMPEEYAVHFRLRGRGAGQQSGTEAGGCDRSERLAIREEGPAAAGAVEAHQGARAGTSSFAWGPSSGSGICATGIHRVGHRRGRGRQGHDMDSRPRDRGLQPDEPPSASASSALPEFEAAAALRGAGWKPRPDDLRPWIAIDSIQPRTFGGLIIEWLERCARERLSRARLESGRRWKTVYTAARAGGKRSYVYLPGLKTRYLRLEIDEPSAGAALRLQSFEFSRSIHAFWHHVADAEARGWHPRWLHREQSLWTPIGTSNGTHCALMNEDGMVEVGQGSFSIEPMLWIEGRLFTWADVTSRQELLDDWMPVPAVIWETGEWRLRIEPRRPRAADCACATGSRISPIGPCRRACSCWCGRFKSPRRGRAFAIWAG